MTLKPTIIPANLIELVDVQKRFNGQDVLKQLTLNVRAGEIYALLGPNGAGKTTTMNVILGFLRADSGRVVVQGLDVGQEPAKARELLAYIPEQVALYPTMTGLDNLRYFTTLAGLTLSKVQLGELLRSAGLDDAAHERQSSKYSKGMRQKVGIALALARKAKVLLLDEPTSGLDPSAAGDFIQSLRALANEGCAILMTTHDLHRLEECADRIGVLSDGKIVGEIDPSESGSDGLHRRYLELLL